MQGNILLAVVLGAPVIAYLLGGYLGRVLRMKDYSWKLSLMFAAVALGLAITVCFWRDIKLGIDLSGGVILIYEVDEAKTAIAVGTDANANRLDADDQVDMNALVQALQRRINPSGVKQVVIREYGARQVEIIIPNVSEAEIEQIKEVIVKSGYLKFRIVANEQDHAEIINLAGLQNDSENPNLRVSKQVKDGDKLVAEWIPLALEENKTVTDPEPYKVSVGERVSRVVNGHREALMIVDPDSRFRVDGSHLRSASTGFDNTANPCVNFRMNSRGSALFGSLTSNNLPDKQAGLYRQLGIVMDDELLSAPTINSTITDDGQITGSFTQKEVDFLVNVLNAGRLPAVLRPNPISENKISPLLGMDTIHKGSFAIAISLSAVLLFMLFYYRFSGVIACLALATNLVLTVALMILISAAFTLPGLAGLVLTVGMSVDANVLIFERIREELSRGAALRMAIRNGFGRATTTIVDANITTLITAVVLYAIGTDQIRGFAVTLILGIVISMFTAIFCSRATFEIAERKRWITRLTMMSLLGTTGIDFIGKRKIAAAVSILVICVGIGAVVVRGKKIFDIDFLGGTSAQVVLQQPVPIEQVRGMAGKLANDVSVTQVNTEDQQRDTVYKIDTSLQTVEELKAKIGEVFRDENGESMLVTHSMTFSSVVETQSGSPTSSTSDIRAATSPKIAQLGAPPRKNSAGQNEELLLAYAQNVQEEVDRLQAVDGTDDAPIDLDTGIIDELNAPISEIADPLDTNVTADADPSTATGIPTGIATDTDAANFDASTPSDLSDSVPPPASGTVPPATGTASSGNATYRTNSDLTFRENISAGALQLEIEQAAESLGYSVPQMRLSNPQWQPGSEAAFSQWHIEFTSEVEQTNAVLKHLQSEIQSMPYFLSSSTIGGAVAGKTQNMALAALITSLIGIVAYIWVRFQRVVFGLAAVIALLHDVAVTIGAVALSFWLSNIFGFLLIDEFKISLPVVAALLTIIGYSLNDTIVVFDRIREVRGRSPDITEAMVNTSINQTLSRTLLTSLTTLLVVGVLYAIGGQGIHGFAFALLIGVVVGTYSTIFVASPALLWMARRAGGVPAPKDKVAA